MSSFKYFSVLTLTVFLVNLTIPFLACHKAQHLQSSEINHSQLSQKDILYCSSSGSRLVKAKDLDDNESNNVNHSCGLCYLSSQNLKYIHPAMHIELTKSETTTYTTDQGADEIPIISFDIRSFLNSRGPPSLS